MGSGVFTPMPQARMMPSSRIFDSAGKAPLPGDLVLLLPTVREIGKVRGNVMHERDVQAVHAEALQAVLDRAAHAVRRVVEYDVVRRVGQRIDFRMPIVLRCLEQLSDFGGKQIVLALLVVQEVSEAPL